LRSVRLRHGSETREIRLETGAARIGDRVVEFEAVERNGRLAEIRIGGGSHRVAAAADGDRVFVWCEGAVLIFEKPRPTRRAAGAEHAGDLISPMPGRVRRTLAAAGEAVEKGQVLLVLEAMKMEHAIRAPRGGILERLLVREGDLVEAGVELAEIAERTAGG
jgi:acetyl/propionyl-CoA carboxylase alpha subunit